ncbi:MAG: MopE-related protein, partial [Saprospiraceae bacterium]
LIGGVSATNGNQLYKIGQFSASQTIFCQADTVDLSVSTVTASFILANSVININDFTPTIRNHLVGSGGWWLDFGTSTFCQSAVDFDADGFALPLDCDDANPAVYPGAADLPNNGIDEDCDGSDLTSATDELPLLQSVQIMPNPMSDQLTIRGDGSLHIGYFLLDGLGRIVLQGKADLTNGGIPIQTGPLPEGIYSLEITDLGSGLSTTRKLIKMAP